MLGKEGELASLGFCTRHKQILKLAKQTAGGAD